MVKRFGFHVLERIRRGHGDEVGVSYSRFAARWWGRAGCWYFTNLHREQCKSI